MWGFTPGAGFGVLVWLCWRFWVGVCSWFRRFGRFWLVLVGFGFAGLVCGLVPAVTLSLVVGFLGGFASCGVGII